MPANNDQDTLMASSSGVPPLSTPAASGSASKRDNLDIQDKYRKLKKRFFELEEKHKEISTELQKSGERNVRIRQERDQLLERIMELEQQGLHGSPGSPSVALPRTLLSARARSSFEENLRNAMDEEDEEDGDDLILPSRHTAAVVPSTRRSTRSSNGKATANGNPSPRTRSKRSEPDDGTLSPAVPSKRHKTRPSVDTTQLGAEAMHEGSDQGEGRGKKNKKAPSHTARVLRNEDEGVPSPEEGGEDVVMQEPLPPPSLSDPFSNPSPTPPLATENEGFTPDVAELGPSATADSQSPPPPEQQSPGPIDPNLEATPSTSSQNTGTSSGPRAVASNGPAPNPLSGNPYLSLSTLMVAKPPSNGAPTPAPATAHPMFMNPYMYYPSPITPVTATPNTPSYPYNPYFYLTAPPMLPGPPPPGMYPPPQQNNAPPPTPTSSTQTRPPQPVDAQQQPRVKPKRMKAHTVTSKSYSIPLVPRDKNGKPMLPLNVGIMTVINLGDVCMREHFHTERYIFPVGYEVTRRYLSTINPNIEVVYHCTILDGGDGPKFQIVPSDTADRPVIAGTATGAWSSIVKQANAIRNRQHSNSVSGPDFFGLGQNTIKHLIQELPGADRLRDYVWQNFIEGGPLGGRHAAVIPALPEEYDAALPRGAVYHSPLERQKRIMEHQTTPSPGELPKGLSHYPQHIIAQAAATGQPLPSLPGQSLPPPGQQPLPGQPQLPAQVQQSVQHAQLQAHQAAQMQQFQDAGRMMFAPLDPQQAAQIQQQHQQLMQQHHPQQAALGQQQHASPQPPLMQSPAPGPSTASGSGLATPVEGGSTSPPQVVPGPALSRTPHQSPHPLAGDGGLQHGVGAPQPTQPQSQRHQQSPHPHPQVEQVSQHHASMTQQPTPITPSSSAPSLASLMQGYRPSA